MRVAYVTTDQANEEFAKLLAEESQLTLHAIEPRDGPPNGEFDAIIYDWDFLPVSLRDGVLTGLTAGGRTCPVTLHTYFLRDEEIRKLRDKGVRVFRRLTGRV
jgi:hypothetical protein